MTAEARGSAPRPFPEPALDRLPERTGRDLPEFGPADLDAELLRAAILRDGCMLIRGLVDRERAEELARGIDRSFAERSSGASGGPSSEAYYEELTLDAPNPQLENLRGWIQSGGGVLAADCPRLAFDMFQIFEAVGLRDAIGGYLGERPAISVEKCTLRKAEPSVAGAWHQDGAFLGDVRSLNVWLSLSRCGDEAPGLDLVPRRLDELVPTGGDEVMFDNRSPRPRQSAPLAIPASRDRSSSRATRCSSTTSSCTAPHPILRCRSHASRSRAGSSLRPRSLRITLHWPPDRGPRLRLADRPHLPK